MNRKKPFVYKRVMAYFIDLIVITLISGILTIVFTNNEAYEEDSLRLMELTKELTSGEKTQEEYYKEFDNINYSLTKNSISVTAITVSVSIVYYVILCYYCHGITLGKYIMHLKIVSANGKELNLCHYLLRCLVVNMVLSNIVTIILIESLSKDTFINYYSRISNGFSILLLISFIMIMYRNDGRGIEDFMGNTKVINWKDEENVSEAIVINK